MYRGFDDDFGLAPRIYRAPDEIRLDIYEAKLAIEKINERLNIRELMLGIISEGGEEMSPEELVLSLEEMVSEAEIVRAVRMGHTTLDGVKFFTRAGMGRCQAGFCTARILQIIARETGKTVQEITKRGGASRITAENEVAK